jgi:hypothetical protein
MELMTSNRQDRGRASRYLLATAAPVAIGLFSASPAAATSCSQLATSFHRANTTITAAQDIPAGTFQGQTGLPQFCRAIAELGDRPRAPTSPRPPNRGYDIGPV